MSDTDDRIKAWLAAHPRTTAATVAVLLLLSQAGVGLAHNTVIYGP